MKINERRKSFTKLFLTHVKSKVHSDRSQRGKFTDTRTHTEALKY